MHRPGRHAEFRQRVLCGEHHPGSFLQRQPQLGEGKPHLQIRLGVPHRRIPGHQQGQQSGTYAFAADQTSLPYLERHHSHWSDARIRLCQFPFGRRQFGSIANPVDPRIGKKQLGIYAQDSWKITRKITFDYGVRYDYSTYLQEQYGRAPFFSPTTPNPAVGNILGAMIFDRNGPGHCNCSLAKNYPLAFAPRLGLAYQFAPKTVLRGGFGIVYAGTEANNNAVPGIAGSSGTVTAPSFGVPVPLFRRDFRLPCILHLGPISIRANST